MNPFRSRNRQSGNDRLPEETDELVDVLRHAYASTPVPSDLMVSIQRAVRTSAYIDSRPREPGPMFSFLKAGLAAAPALAVLIAVLASRASTPTPIPQLGSAQPAAAHVVWHSNKSQLSQRRLALVAPGVIKVTNSGQNAYKESGSGFGLHSGSGKKYDDGPSLRVYTYAQRNLKAVACPATPLAKSGANAGQCYRIANVAEQKARYVLVVEGRTSIRAPSASPKDAGSTYSQYLPSTLSDFANCPQADACWLIRKIQQRQR